MSKLTARRLVEPARVATRTHRTAPSPDGCSAHGVGAYPWGCATRGASRPVSSRLAVGTHPRSTGGFAGATYPSAQRFQRALCDRSPARSESPAPRQGSARVEVWFQRGPSWQGACSCVAIVKDAGRVVKPLRSGKLDKPLQIVYTCTSMLGEMGLRAHGRGSET